MSKKKNGVAVFCAHCEGDGRTSEDICQHCEGTGQQWLYSGGAIARSYTGLLDGMLTHKALKVLLAAPPARALRRAKGAMRRKFERRRKKFDKWAEPKGQKPAKKNSALVALVDKPKPEEAPPVVIDNEPIIVDIHHADHETKVLYEKDETTGEFNFRDTILEQLDRYFFYIDRMKKNDINAYQLYCQVGSIMVPYYGNVSIHASLTGKRWGDAPKVLRIQEWFLKNKPSFGCIAYGTQPETEKWEEVNAAGGQNFQPKFLYFHKLAGLPIDTELRHGGTFYKLTVYWDVPKDRLFKHGGIPLNIALFIGDDGSIGVLKYRIFRKMKHGIPTRRWKIPTIYKDWARENSDQVEPFIGKLFHDVAQYLENASHAMIRVEAQKGALCGYFNVDLARVPYFFSDRDYVLTPSGLRKPVFHSVRAHERKNGSSVRFHFRGQRHFDWADYEIRITVPGRDHAPIGGSDIGGMRDGGSTFSKDKYVTSDEAGRRLHDYVHGKLT